MLPLGRLFGSSVCIIFAGFKAWAMQAESCVSAWER
jgi:hypothetical protein